MIDSAVGGINAAPNPCSARVRIKTDQPVDDARVHDGVLIASDEQRIELEVDGSRRVIPVPAIRSARTVADWSAELKRSAV